MASRLGDMEQAQLGECHARDAGRVDLRKSRQAGGLEAARTVRLMSCGHKAVF